MFNDRWWFDRYNLEGLKTYINDLTFGANVLLGMQKYKLNSLPEQKYEYCDELFILRSKLQLNMFLL